MKSLLPILILLPALLLSACQNLSVPVNRSEPTADKALARAVYQRLGDSLVEDAGEIAVSARNGTVTLRGSIGTQAARLQAESIAANTPGVKRVDNQLVP